MNTIEYFKLQAKNLFADYKTKISRIDAEEGYSYFDYEPKYFDINGIFLHFDTDEENFSLMKAQHIIAVLAGFNKWNDLHGATNAELSLAKLLFDNQDKVSYEDWQMYIVDAEAGFPIEMRNDETRLEIFQTVFADVAGHESLFGDFRLNGSNKYYYPQKDK